MDREQEITEVVSAVDEGGKLFLIGPRRYGKTSILKAAQKKATDAGSVVLRFNAEAYATLEDLMAAILAEATARLSGKLSQANQKVKKLFGRLKPEVTWELESQTFSVKIGAETDPGDRFRCWSRSSTGWSGWPRNPAVRSD